MILADVLAALSWLYLNPEGKRRKQAQEAIRSAPLTDSLKIEGASL